MAYRLEESFGISDTRFEGERRGRQHEVCSGIKRREDRHVKKGPGLDARRAAIERLFQHGGDIKSASQAFPDALSPWIDLSTGLNPVAYPIPALAEEVWSRLPEPGALEALLAVAAQHYGAAPECLAAAAGTQAILQTLPRLFPFRRVSVLGPTYSEHARVWRGTGAEVEVSRELESTTAPQVVVVNPNNPDGRLYPKEYLRDCARRLAHEGRRLIVDEAFMDFEDESIASERLPATIVLRSFGKAYGLAGLRLGFAIATPAIAAEIRAALGPWPISGPAIAIGTQALADSAWLIGARDRLDSDGAWLDDSLRRADHEIVGGTRLFRLTRRRGAAKTFRSLCKMGILTRPFTWDEDLLRWGIPLIQQRARLCEALTTSC
jgi:cobalamin biosynthetic protein CobC